jgi:hypothetical protein
MKGMKSLEYLLLTTKAFLKKRISALGQPMVIFHTVEDKAKIIDIRLNEILAILCWKLDDE